MNKFQDTYDLPKLKQEDIQDQNRLITSNWDWSIDNSLLMKNNTRLDSVTAELYHTYKKESVLMLLNYPIRQKGKEYF
jgi:hypothetical protein